MSGSRDKQRRRAEHEEPQRTPEVVPTPEVSRATISDLIHAWPPHPVVNAKYMDGAWARSASIWVFAEHAVQTAKAVLALDNQGMYMQCSPLARLVFECGVTAVWMAKTDYSGHRISEGARRQYLSLRHEFADMAGVPEPQDDTDSEGAAFKKQQPNFKQRADSLDGGKWIYRYYRLLSNTSHGEGPLVQEYLEQVEENHAFGHPFQIRDPGRWEHRYVVLALTVVMLNFAMLAWDQVSDDHKLRGPLEEIARKHGLNSFPFTDEEMGRKAS